MRELGRDLRQRLRSVSILSIHTRTQREEKRREEKQGVQLTKFGASILKHSVGISLDWTGQETSAHERTDPPNSSSSMIKNQPNASNKPQVVTSEPKQGEIRGTLINQSIRKGRYPKPRQASNLVSVKAVMYICVMHIRVTSCPARTKEE